MRYLCRCGAIWIDEVDTYKTEDCRGIYSGKWHISFTPFRGESMVPSKYPGGAVAVAVADVVMAVQLVQKLCVWYCGKGTDCVWMACSASNHVS